MTFTPFQEAVATIGAHSTAFVLVLRTGEDKHTIVVKGDDGDLRMAAYDWSNEKIVQRSAEDVEETIARARDWITMPGIAKWESYEGLVEQFAEALVKIAGACVIGLPCEQHGGAVHGREAEDLRKGVEKILDDHGTSPSDAHDAYEELRQDLQRLLDEIDARDSLRFLEATKHDVQAELP